MERPAPVKKKRPDITASDAVVWLFVLCGFLMVGFGVWAVFAG